MTFFSNKCYINHKQAENSFENQNESQWADLSYSGNLYHFLGNLLNYNNMEKSGCFRDKLRFFRNDFFLQICVVAGQKLPKIVLCLKLNHIQMSTKKNLSFRS